VEQGEGRQWYPTLWYCGIPLKVLRKTTNIFNKHSHSPASISTGLTQTTQSSYVWSSFTPCCVNVNPRCYIMGLQIINGHSCIKSYGRKRPFYLRVTGIDTSASVVCCMVRAVNIFRSNYIQKLPYMERIKQ